MPLAWSRNHALSQSTNLKLLSKLHKISFNRFKVCGLKVALPLFPTHHMHQIWFSATISFLPDSKSDALEKDFTQMRIRWKNVYNEGPAVSDYRNVGGLLQQIPCSRWRLYRRIKHSQKKNALSFSANNFSAHVIRKHALLFTFWGLELKALIRLCHFIFCGKKSSFFEIFVFLRTLTNKYELLFQISSIILSD